MAVAQTATPAHPAGGTSCPGVFHTCPAWPLRIRRLLETVGGRRARASADRLTREFPCPGRGWVRRPCCVYGAGVLVVLQSHRLFGSRIAQPRPRGRATVPRPALSRFAAGVLRIVPVDALPVHGLGAHPRPRRVGGGCSVHAVGRSPLRLVRPAEGEYDIR